MSRQFDLCEICEIYLPLHFALSILVKWEEMGGLTKGFKYYYCYHHYYYYYYCYHYYYSNAKST